MDSTAQVSELIGRLDEDLVTLQTVLKNIISKSLTDVAKDYPVLDRAKLYILVTYAIESAIFCTSAREHPVYRELERVKQYFQKAKLAEMTIQKPAMRLDQAAAGRFIKAALAGNETPKPKESATMDAIQVMEPLASPRLDNTAFKKRKLEEMSQEPKQSSVLVQISENSDKDSDDNDGIQTTLAEPSVSGSIAPSPTKDFQSSITAKKPSQLGPETSKVLTKAQRKRLRKAGKLNATPENATVDETPSAEPRLKKSKKETAEQSPQTPKNEQDGKEKKKKKRNKDRKSKG